MPIPLNRLPELFFDAQLWEIFVSYFDGPEVALERIGYRPDLTGYHREGDAVFAKRDKDPWQEIEEALAVGRALLRGLRTKFEKKELTATGIPRGFAERVRRPIPPALWLELWPNFSGGWAMGSAESYDEIQVSWHVNSGRGNAELLDRLEKYLREQKGKGDSLKKTLIAASAEYFGQHIPTRVFNEVYHKIFKRPRGRPPRKNK
jgi:hypothetical protein